MVTSVQVPDADAMRSLGKKIASLLRAGDVVTLTGPLGAGKTTLTQGIGQGLGIIGSVTSPTFVVSRLHRNRESGLALVHVDAYRLQSADELIDLDLDAIPNSVVIIEWGAPYVAQITDSWLEVTLRRGSEEEEVDPSAGNRQVSFTGHGLRWESLDLGVMLDA